MNTSKPEKTKTYEIRVICTNCEYGRSSFNSYEYESIKVGHTVPAKMECPECSCLTLIKYYKGRG